MTTMTTTTTLTVKLSGKDQNTMTVEGIEVNGFFVHRTVLVNPKYATWTVSHLQSGQNLGARFHKRRDAMQFARDMATNYNGHLLTRGIDRAVSHARGEAVLC